MSQSVHLHPLPPPTTFSSSQPYNSPPAYNSQIPCSPFAAFTPSETHPHSTTAPIPLIPEHEKLKRAWKYEGYKAFSRWMVSDTDFFVIRRFGALNARTMLWMQDRIMQIETRLEEMDQEIENAPDDQGMRNSSFRWDVKYVPERDKLMCQLSGILHHYNQYVETFCNVGARPKAADPHIRNVKNWLMRNSITSDEKAFLDRDYDLIAVLSETRSPLHQLVTEVARILGISRLVRYIQIRQHPPDPPDPPDQPDQPDQQYQRTSDKKNPIRLLFS